MDAKTLFGRLVRVERAVGGGFIKGNDGTLVYFELSDVVGGGALRENARVQYRTTGAGVPRALWVAPAT